MTTVNLKVGDKDLEIARRSLGNLKPVLTEIGVYLLEKTQDAFRDQSFGSKKWPERMTPNVAGIVSDFNKGQKPKKRRFDGRPALVDTGRLRQSFNFRVKKNTVEVGTALGYAQIQHKGGESKVRLTSIGKAGLADFLRENKSMAKSLGWLFKKSSFTVKVRARPLVGIDKDDTKEILDIIRDAMEV